MYSASRLGWNETEPKPVSWRQRCQISVCYTVKVGQGFLVNISKNKYQDSTRLIVLSVLEVFFLKELFDDKTADTYLMLILGVFII